MHADGRIAPFGDVDLQTVRRRGKPDPQRLEGSKSGPACEDGAAGRKDTLHVGTGRKRFDGNVILGKRKDMLESKCAIRIGVGIDFLIELGVAACQLDVQA